MGTMLVSLIAALVAALCYGVASVMQAIAVREASRRHQAGLCQQEFKQLRDAFHRALAVLHQLFRLIHLCP